jgi:conjugative relaxase-like TrwC/TraI family protein
MLTISPPIRASQGDYYLSLAAVDDYYMDAAEPPGFWLGQGAAALGLAGEVRPDDFRMLLAGQTPDGRKVRNAVSAKRRAGWDLTWSAPKSVSVAWSQATPEIREEIEAALKSAVTFGVAYLETVGVVSRVGENGVVRDPAKLVFAAFRHSTSRAQQPQLHHHTILKNLAVRSDGKIGTIDPRELYRHQMAAGALFRVQLAHELERRLGLRVRREGRCFEIIGVDRELIATFSQRRREIEAVLRATGRSGAKAAEWAALATRSSKKPRPRAELFAEWQEVGRQHGWTMKELSLLLHAPWSPRDRERDLQRVANDALAVLTSRESHFPKRRLTQHLAEEAQTRGLSGTDILAMRDGLLRCPELVPLNPWQGEAQFTTREMLRLEGSLLNHARVLSEQAKAGFGLELDEALRRHPELSLEQQQALSHLCGDGSSLRLVSGLAGTGKSRLLGVAHEVWGQQGCVVTGAALCGKAASGMQQEAGIPAQTVHRLLHALREERLVLNDRSVVVIDEAGMLGTRMLHAVLEACVAAKSTLVLCGDAAQLQPVEAGGPFAALINRFGAAELTDIRRQQDAWAREAVAQLARGEVRIALAAYDERGLVHSNEQPETALVAAWREQGGLILAGTNDEVARLNLQAQESCYSSDPCVVHSSGSFHRGDRVLFTRNDPTLGIFNGDLGTVVAGEGSTVVVNLDHGRSVTVDLDRYPSLRLGYAVTTHKAQGLTTDATLILTGTMQDRELTYVQASRARSKTEFFTPEEPIERLAERMSLSRRKMLASELAPELRLELSR